jgi:glutamine synthetase
MALVDLAWTDFDGRLEFVTVPLERAEAPLELELSGEALGWAGLDEPLHPVPDGNRIPSPWGGDRDVILCRLAGPDGERSPACARSILGRAVDRAKSADLEPVMAAEVEFVLRTGPDGDPVYPFIDNYGIYAGAAYESIMRRVRALRFDGIRVTATNPEYGPGQFEVNLSHGPALGAADAVCLLRSHVETLAAAAGLYADFAAKPRGDLSGNGLHVHQSLWRRGRNAFWAEGLSQQGAGYLAGLLGGIGELAALGSPTEAAYQRREVGSFCPTVISWGGDNRTVAVRALADTEGATRLEQRDAAADANPHLIFAGQIHAGLDGLEREADPGPRTEGDAYGRADLPSLPTDLAEALPLLEMSEQGRRVLGEPAHAAFCSTLASRIGSGAF